MSTSADVGSRSTSVGESGGSEIGGGLIERRRLAAESDAAVGLRRSSDAAVLVGLASTQLGDSVSGQRLMPLFNILFGYIQVMGQMGVVLTGIKLPANLLNFLAGLNFFSLPLDAIEAVW